jgi:flagellar hook-length control protein FliK
MLPSAAPVPAPIESAAQHTAAPIPASQPARALAPAESAQLAQSTQDGASAQSGHKGQASAGAFSSAMADSAKEQPGVAVLDRGAVGAVPSAPAQQATDTVTLSGPPTAWRQNLREALGERLQLQMGRNSEQAVIRLEPPMLGQVEIAIRHSAGALEVSISATHREVVRQLQAVSEHLRSDLAQRQFTEVAVSVTPTRAGAQASSFFGGEQQGRGRQPDEQKEANPGQALAEAHRDSATFSLNGRL